jgi:hypothetical protein
VSPRPGQLERDLAHARQLVDEVLDELGLKASSRPLEGGWALVQGQTPVYVFVTSTGGGPGAGGEGDGGLIQVVAPVMAVPASGRVALLRRLLELNGEELVSAGFGLKEGTVVITTDRSLGDLDRSEVREMILRISHYGQHFRRELEAEFGSSSAAQ